MTMSTLNIQEPHAHEEPKASRRPRQRALQSQLAGKLVSKASADLIRRVCGRMQVLVADVLSESQDREISDARHVACWALRQRGHSFPKIGVIMGRDHRTVMAAVKKIERERADSEEIARMLDEMMNEETEES